MTEQRGFLQRYDAKAIWDGEQLIEGRGLEDDLECEESERYRGREFEYYFPQVGSRGGSSSLKCAEEGGVFSRVQSELSRMRARLFGRGSLSSETSWEREKPGEISRVRGAEY